MNTSVDIGSLKFNVEIVLLEEINGDGVLIELLKKIEKNNSRDSIEEDMCRLIMLSFMKSSIERQKRIAEVLLILDQLVDEDRKDSIRLIMINLAEQLLSNTKGMEEIKQVLKEW